MKLYATIESSRESRPAKKGDDRMLKVTFTAKQWRLGSVILRSVGENTELVWVSPQAIEEILKRIKA